MAIDTALYTAQATSTGGRTGKDHEDEVREVEGAFEG